MKQLGLIGFPLTHSFSANYFKQKFETAQLDNQWSYKNYPLSDIADLHALLAMKELVGLNVTIPYKKAVLPFCSQLDEVATAVGAVNTLARTTSGWKGYNTDVIGLEKSLLPLIRPHHQQAFIFGTGGSAQAVAYVLRQIGIHYQFVSRTAGTGVIAYQELLFSDLRSHKLWINTTPIGQFPAVDACLNLDYSQVGEQHVLFDLIYNPSRTLFLQKGIEHGAKVLNGEQMLVAQAEAAFEIWQRTI